MGGWRGLEVGTLEGAPEEWFGDERKDVEKRSLLFLSKVYAKASELSRIELARQSNELMIGFVSVMP